VQRKRLGRTSLDVGRLSLGCVTFGREIDEGTSFAILDHATDSGMNLLDTAAVYGGGQSETIIGRWLVARGCRDRVLVQTKLLPPLNAQHIAESLEASLRRLQTDYVDLLLFHAADPQTPIAESLEAIGAAIRAGKVRFAGCSNFSADQLRTALDAADAGALPRLDVTQFNYNLAVRDAEDALLPLCAERGVGVQTYSPLGAGFLTGKYDRTSQDLPAGSRFDVVPGHRDIYFHAEKFEVARRLRELSGKTGVPLPQLAVAWVLKNPRVDTVLVGARTREHVASAVAALAVDFELAWEREMRIAQSSQPHIGL
jgi:aryl-alcohol dehydrogenase-like predicted oxidoreductase